MKRLFTFALFLTVLTACGPVPGYSDQGESGKLRKIQLQSSQEDLPHTGLVTGSGSIAVYGVGDTLEAFLLDGEGFSQPRITMKVRYSP